MENINNYYMYWLWLLANTFEGKKKTLRFQSVAYSQHVNQLYQNKTKQNTEKPNTVA